MGRYTGSNIIIPDTYNGLPVTEIASYAFQGKNISSVVIGNNIKVIGSYAFNNCSYLKAITWGEKVERIQNSAFSYSAITGLSLPDSVKGIGSQAFCYCRSLTSVSVGNGVQSIADNAFSWCFDLRNFSYRGTKEEWGKVIVTSWFAQETGFSYIYCSDGSIAFSDPGDGAD